MVLSYIFEDENNPKTSYAAEKKFKELGHIVNKQSIHGWIANREKIMQSDNKKKRLEGAGRKTFLAPDLEDFLIGLINEERREGNRDSGTQVQAWAKEIAAENELEGFNASYGWLYRFMQRNGYSYRRITNLTTLSSEELIRRAVSFMEFLQSARESGLRVENTLLMDETAVYLEDPRRVTINESGKRHVCLRSTGYASMRITVILTVTANGKKLKPVIIHKKGGAGGATFELKNGCFVCYNDKAWVNSELIKKWIDLVHPLVANGEGKALVWDSCRAHTANIVKEHLRRRGIKNIVVPGGLTPYVQAGDLGIYKSFKDQIGPIIALWKNSLESKTPKGTPKPPTLETVLKWVHTAWTKVPESVVLNSIRAAGFGEDTQWHVYKHDVYGAAFRGAWLSREMVPPVEPQVLAEDEVEEDENVVIED